MGTLKGFASPFGPPPAASSPLASPFGDFGTCTFPTTPARYARALALGLAKPSGALAPGLAAAAAAANPWAKPAFAYAIMGTLRGFASPFGPPRDWQVPRDFG